MNRVLKGWNEAEKFIVGILTLSATFVAFWAALARYLLHNPPDWAEEVAIYLIIWAVFINASRLAEERGHVAATLLVERFPLKMRRILAAFNGGVALVFCILVSVLGYQITATAYIIEEKSLTGLRFPLWIAYLSVALGCLLVALRYVKRIYRVLFRFDPSEIMETHELSREDKSS